MSRVTQCDFCDNIRQDGGSGWITLTIEELSGKSGLRNLADTPADLCSPVCLRDYIDNIKDRELEW